MEHPLRARILDDLSHTQCRSTVAKLEKPKYVVVKTLGSSTRYHTSTARPMPVFCLATLAEHPPDIEIGLLQSTL